MPCSRLSAGHLVHSLRAGDVEHTPKQLLGRRHLLGESPFGRIQLGTHNVRWVDADALLLKALPDGPEAVGRAVCAGASRAPAPGQVVHLSCWAGKGFSTMP